MYLPCAHTHATRPYLHHSVLSQDGFALKDQWPQSPLPRGELSEDKGGVGPCQRNHGLTWPSQRCHLSGLSSTAEANRRLCNWKVHPSRRRNAAFTTWARTWNIKEAVLGAPRSAAICSESFLVLVSAPISPARPARIWSNWEF
jgi:hypothetical protein